MSFDDLYRRVRNRLRKFYRISIALEVLRQVNQPASDPVEELRKAVWQALLLVKWAYQDSMGDKQATGPATPRDIFELRQLLWEGQASSSPLIGDHNTAFLFVRQILRAQVEMQRLETQSLVREEVIIGQLSDSHKLRKMVEQELGLKLSEIIDLKLLFFSGMKSGDGAMHPAFLQPILPIYGSGKVRGFLTKIAQDHSGLIEFFQSFPDRKEKKTLSEYFEFPALVNYPILHHGGTYHWWHRMVFARGLEGLVHRKMDAYGQKFIDAYGGAFENYALDMLPSFELKSMREKELSARFGSEVKLPDGVLLHKNANIILECKSFLYREGRMTVGSARVFPHKLKGVIKAVEQAHSLSHEIRKRSDVSNEFTLHSADFLLIVCNVDLIIGNLYKFAELFDEKKERLEAKYFCSDLPLNHIYVVSIDEFERFCSVAGMHGIDVVEFLIRASSDDADHRTAKFSFKQHLDAVGRTYVSSKVSGAISRSESRIERYLGNG